MTRRPSQGDPDGPRKARRAGVRRGQTESGEGSEEEARSGTGRETQPRTGLVTETRLQVRDSNRLSIYVDGSFSFGMPFDAALELDIRKGIELDEDLLEQCLTADERYRVRQRALGLLAHRPRSTSELRDRLARGGFSPDAVAFALERMDQLGYLDDEAFATAFARHRLLTKGQGRRRVIADLRRKGIASEQAERIVSGLAEDLDERANAGEQARTRLARMGELEPEKIRRRLYAYLARRGFDPGIIHQAIQTAMADKDDRA